MRSGSFRALVLYGGFALSIALGLVVASEPLCLTSVAWITVGSSVLARDVARWSRGASLGLGLELDETALFWVARVGGGLAGAVALVLAVAGVA